MMGKNKNQEEDKVICPKCNKTIEIDAKLNGLSIICPHCNAPI